MALKLTNRVCLFIKNLTFFYLGPWQARYDDTECWEMLQEFITSQQITEYPVQIDPEVLGEEQTTRLTYYLVSHFISGLLNYQNIWSYSELIFINCEFESLILNSMYHLQIFKFMRSTKIMHCAPLPEGILAEPFDLFGPTRLAVNHVVG